MPPLEDAAQAESKLLARVCKQKRMFTDMVNYAQALPVVFDFELVGHLQLDIQLDGIEIGSYGVREFLGQHYIYGTALALPRFQQALVKAGAL